MRSVRARGAGGRDRLGGVAARDRWRAVVPGWPQWRRGQRSRAAVLAGSYVSALGVGLFAWGSGLGAGLIGFAIFAHVASVADAIRQAAFPGFGPWAPWYAAGFGLGAAGYGPALAIALQFAFPARTPDGAYLVDRTAYRDRGPEAGHWVWLDRDGAGEPRAVARVVAVGAQQVSWSEGRFLVDGLPAAVPLGPTDPGRRSGGSFDVPEGAILVACEDPGRAAGPGADRSSWEHLELVPVGRAIGRPWARSFPVWHRRLLA